MLSKIVASSLTSAPRILRQVKTHPQRYWIATVSLEHAQTAEQGSFIQVCHGKKRPLEQLYPSDHLLIYAPRKQLRGKASYQKFVACGTVQDDSIYQVKMFEGFTPFRRNIRFEPTNHVDVRPLIPQLSFIKNKQNWGMPFRRGLFEIPKSDFFRILSKMIKK